MLPTIGGSADPPGERIETLRLGNRQRPQEQSVDQPERGRAGPDCKGQRKNRRGGCDLALFNLPPSENNVGLERVEAWDHPSLTPAGSLGFQKLQ